MPEYQFYYTTQGETAGTCERAYRYWQAIVKQTENKIWATDYNKAPPMSGVKLTTSENKLPMLEHLITGKKWYGEEVVDQLARLVGGVNVASQRYVMYTSSDINYRPIGKAIMIQNYEDIMKSYKKAYRKWKTRGKPDQSGPPTPPEYLLNKSNRLPILVTREETPTVWYGTFAIDWARVVESMDSN